MNPQRVTLLTLLAASTVLLCVSVPGMQPDSRTQGSAVDSKGVRHYEADYPRHNVPWSDDLLQAFALEYPYDDRAQHHEGEGLFRLALDLKTGSVSKITVLKSTGFSTLDSCAIASLRHFRWKPGKWKEINTPITFQIRSRLPQLKPGQKPLPHLR
jgi:TonB family protein